MIVKMKKVAATIEGEEKTRALLCDICDAS